MLEAPAGSRPSPARRGAAPSSPSSSSAAAGADEALVLRLLAGWRAYKEWLGSVRVFRPAGTACCAIRLLHPAPPHRELATQNTSLIDAGHAAFRGAASARLPRRRACTPGARRCSFGGYSPEGSC